MKPIVIYTTPWCGYCVAAKGLLDEKGVQYEEVDVAGDPELRRDVARQSGRLTVPQVFADGHPLGGYSELVELEREGRLDECLGLG